MILELVQWTVKPNQRRDFESAFEQAQHILSNASGYRTHSFQKCLENPDKYILLVQWETLEDHTVGFRDSESYQKYRALLKPHYEAGATMEHYVTVHEHAQ